MLFQVGGSGVHSEPAHGGRDPDRAAGTPEPGAGGLQRNTERASGLFEATWSVLSEACCVGTSGAGSRQMAALPMAMQLELQAAREQGLNPRFNVHGVRGCWETSARAFPARQLFSCHRVKRVFIIKDR